jgi:hypothetical protein
MPEYGLEYPRHKRIHPIESGGAGRAHRGGVALHLACQDEGEEGGSRCRLAYQIDPTKMVTEMIQNAFAAQPNSIAASVCADARR